MKQLINNERVLAQATQVLRDGGIIAYPTEGVFGLGCDPFNATAVLRLLKLKHRNTDKGVILLASSWRQVAKLIKINKRDRMLINTISHPVTWICPATTKVPRWICGKFPSVAIRVTLHPLAQRICDQFGGSIVSTSANLEGDAPAKSAQELTQQLVWGIDFVVSGEVGHLQKPTEIRQVKTNTIIRA